ncbi:MAG: cytochrome c1 [Desulfovibrionaceae bacterium]|nr:cytochrome c1 [Desulfovibrionaceae bacterium]
MNVWKKLILSLALATGLGGSAFASEGGVAWDKAPVDTKDQASLQRGVKTFVEYCLGCHSAAAMRFNRLKDIGLTEQQIKNELLFTTEKVGDTMVAAIDPAQAKAWFGTTPPDLSVIARSRAGAGGSGADYIYTLLRSYYRDDTKPTGWNNITFPSIAMPHSLWELQGERRPVFQKHEQYGHEVEVFSGWEQVSPGAMTPDQFDKTVGDLVTYLQWMGEPAQNTRVKIGIWVMLFLLLFTFTAWRLNAAYWKDVT